MGTNGSMGGQHVGQAVIGCCLGGWGGRGSCQLRCVRLRLELARLGRHLELDVKVVDHARRLPLALCAVEEEPRDSLPWDESILVCHLGGGLAIERREIRAVGFNCFNFVLLCTVSTRKNMENHDNPVKIMGKRKTDRSISSLLSTVATCSTSQHWLAH